MSSVKMSLNVNRVACTELAALFLALCSCAGQPPLAESGGIVVVPISAEPVACDSGRVAALQAGDRSGVPIAGRYRELRVIDIHNHGAAGDPEAAIRLQTDSYIDATVLFGNISEPRAVESDRKSYETYKKFPSQVYPFFAGIPLRDPEGITMATANLEKGYFGIGEIVAASIHSPATSRLPWKANHPLDGILPDLYALCADYQVPLLLHIDPPLGEPIVFLERALSEYPDTNFIFGHANAFSSPENIERLLSRHPNLYVDFYAGFTRYNPLSTQSLGDFVPVIETYPDRIMVGTDSGYGIDPRHAIDAIYELFDLLKPETVCLVAHGNFDRLIEAQVPTGTQVTYIAELSRILRESGQRRLNKRMANELIFELEQRLPK